MKKLTLLVLSVAFASLSSCNTVQGLGRDMQTVGGYLNGSSGR